MGDQSGAILSYYGSLQSLEEEEGDGTCNRCVYFLRW